VKYHRLGTPPASDPVVFPKTGDPETELEAELSRDGRHLLVSVVRGASVTELHYRDLGRPASPWVALVKGHDGTMAATAHRGLIYLRTTDGAPYGRVVRIDSQKPARAKLERGRCRRRGRGARRRARRRRAARAELRAPGQERN
jgi:prolyl oligopeptidase